jgi:peptide/nickel transport system substrate-binding protein
MPGMVLDRYRTTRELGRGAMGVVYRAWDTNLEREVAIKVMAEELRTNPEALQLFTQEAKSLAQLNHANIVTIYDQVTINDKVYMIMELVDGTTLEDTLLTKKAFKWRDAAALVDQLCSGLAYAHARKIIHRDIKPANIFMTSDGGVKLGDFGLARVMRELRFRATEVRGTPLYMAPEQITGTDIDHRTDLYAVGCTFYELVTGRPPFVDGDILYQQVHTNPIPPSILVTGVPQLLERLIMNLLSKQLDGRPRTANEVRSVIKSVS